MQPVIEAAEAAIRSEVESVKELSEVASKFPYYKYVSSRGGDMFKLDGADRGIDIMACGRRIFRMSSLRSSYVDGWVVWQRSRSPPK